MRAPTGHGFSLPNEGGEAAANIVFKVARGEAKTVEEMIAATERGLLVTRLWYIREVDAYEKILTGMTRDGTFVVENGRVGKGIRNFRFNQSVLQMLRQVLDLGDPVRACGEEAFDMVAPAMRVEGFHFTETTRVLAEVHGMPTDASTKYDYRKGDTLVIIQFRKRAVYC